MALRQVGAIDIQRAALAQGMDLAPPNHYVQPSMEFLLILSALLSAVTGAFSSARGPEARVHQAEAAIGAQLVISTAEQQAPAAISARPTDEPAPVRVETRRDFALPAAIPAYADRLRE